MWAFDVEKDTPCKSNTTIADEIIRSYDFECVFYYSNAIRLRDVLRRHILTDTVRCLNKFDTIAYVEAYFEEFDMKRIKFIVYCSVFAPRGISQEKVGM